MDPTQTYKLTFFGSINSSTDNTTRYSIFTDNTYTTLVGSVDLLVRVNNLHNRDQVAVLNNIAPQAGNILYVQFFGQAAVVMGTEQSGDRNRPGPETPVTLVGGVSLLLGLRRQGRTA